MATDILNPTNSHIYRLIMYEKSQEILLNLKAIVIPYHTNGNS